jgi:hypothetical protein
MSTDERRPTTADLAGEETVHERDDQHKDTSEDERLQPLLSEDEGARFRQEWQEVQTDFVDAPQGSVKHADALVAELMQRLAQTFSEERQNLESQWSQGDDVSTEELRVALQRYRSFFERLLST